MCGERECGSMCVKRVCGSVCKQRVCVCVGGGGGVHSCVSDAEIL